MTSTERTIGVSLSPRELHILVVNLGHRYQEFPTRTENPEMYDLWLHLRQSEVNYHVIQLEDEERSEAQHNARIDRLNVILNGSKTAADAATEA